MTRATLLLLLLLPLALPASAQELDPGFKGGKLRPPQRIFPEEILRAPKGYRTSNRLLFVIDVSGSMRGCLNQAVDSCLLIMGTDECRAGVIAFTSSASRWEGVPEHAPHDAPPGAPPVQGLARPGRSLLFSRCNDRCVPRGWAALPTRYAEVGGWLQGLGAGGGTNPSPALEAALHDRTPNLSIVFVSDGGFPGRLALEAVKRGRAWRRKQGLPGAPIMVWGAGDDARDTSSLLELAKVGGGGFWVHGSKRSGPW